MRFSSGAVGGADKDFTQYVRCVREGDLKPPSLSRNAGTEIVTDLATGLQWQDDSDVVTTKRIWTDAIDYCEELELGGDYDWRLPNVNEIFSIIDYSRRGPAIDTSVFVNTNPSTTTGEWTSTTYADQTERAWRLFPGSGLLQGGSGIKTFTFYVRCVRGGEGEAGGNYGFIPPVISLLLFF